jgi:hypothetical protein
VVKLGTLTGIDYFFRLGFSKRGFGSNQSSLGLRVGLASRGGLFSSLLILRQVIA